MTNATWKKNPGSNNFDAAGNWSPATVPNGTAFFGPSNITNLTFSVTTTIGGWNFKSNASHYSFNIPLLGLPFDGLDFVGAGIVVKGGSASITNSENLKFHNASTAGIAHITNNGNVSFYDTSTAGSAKFTNENFVQFFGASKAGRAHITNHDTVEFYNGSKAAKSVIVNDAGADLHFSDSSTAGAARLNNAGGGDVDFYISSKAGAARISNAGDIRFHDDSSAANATIKNVAFGLVQFFDSSVAGNARISADIVDFMDNSLAFRAHIAATRLTFFDQSQVGLAVITTVSGARTEFHDNSGGGGRFITKAGGVVDFSLSSGQGGSQIISASSIEGAGTYKLGGNDLYVGYNNRSTNVSGAIDGTAAASLHKVGTGTLKLSHAFNTYAGGTYIDQGTLDVAAKGAAGGGVIFFQPGKQTLKIENAALTNHAFGNTVEFFGAGDAIDLAGLKFVTRAKATYDQASEILTVHSGKVTVTLELADPSVLKFKVVDDGHGGSKIIAKPPGAKPNSDAHRDSQHTAGFMATDQANDSFQFEHQAELGRHSATSFDLHLGLGTEISAFTEYRGNLPGMDHELHLANFHIDAHHVANLDGHNFMA